MEMIQRSEESVKHLSLILRVLENFQDIQGPDRLQISKLWPRYGRFNGATKRYTAILIKVAFLGKNPIFYICWMYISNNHIQISSWYNYLISIKPIHSYFGRFPEYIITTSPIH